MCFIAYNYSVLWLFHDILMFSFSCILQYQNVFAPLIKLEADYDKVCFRTFFFPLLCFFLFLFNLIHYLATYAPIFVIYDERISKQGQCYNPLGYWS